MSSFNSLSGGLVDTVVAGVGNNVSTAIQNIGSGQASFSINSVLGGVVQDASGYALNAGQNYVLNQLGASLGNSEYSALANAVVTQVATAGINQAINFVSQAIPNPFLGGGGTNVTTAGLANQGSRGSISIPDDVVSRLEDADYGGIAYTVQDIVFTLTPAQPGAQAQQPPQTAPTVPLDVAFNPSTNLNNNAVDALKSQVAFNLPAKGRTFDPNATSVYTTQTSATPKLIRPAF
jgi:hypothetical protein